MNGIDQSSLVGVLADEEISFTLAPVELAEKHGDPSYLQASPDLPSFLTGKHRN